MDTNNPVVQICIEGTRAEYRGEIERACELYRAAWEAAGDDYEACVAAHYVARHQEDPEVQLYWNRVALDRAEAVGEGRAEAFLPSLYLNMGLSLDRLGEYEKARRYYQLAAAIKTQLGRP